MSFIESVQPQLMNDMAAGDGEYLNALAGLYQCNDSGTAIFKNEVKENFSTLNKPGATAGELLYLLETTLQKNKSLQNTCAAL